VSPAFILPLLAAAATPDAKSAPINVVGHAWAPFISPMGEPFRARSVTDDTLADWFARADRNRDGMLTADEMQADAERFYALLDTDHNGEIDPDEIANYEWEIAPDIQVMSKTRRAPGEVAASPRPLHEDKDSGRRRSRAAKEEEANLGIGGGLQGAARYGLLNIPEPVAAADMDFDRGISLAEFRQAAVTRFALLDSGHSGRLTLTQLQGLRAAALADGRRKRSKDAADTRVGNSLPPGN
jgi:EF hand